MDGTQSANFVLFSQLEASLQIHRLLNTGQERTFVISLPLVYLTLPDITAHTKISKNLQLCICILEASSDQILEVATIWERGYLN